MRDLGYVLSIKASGYVLSGANQGCCEEMARNPDGLPCA